MKYCILTLSLFISTLTFSQQQANLLGRWDDSTLIGSAAYNNTYNEIWGLAVNGREYAVLGSTKGTHIIDVTDPTQPTEVAFVQGALSGSAVIHRDYHDHKGFLYAVCDEGWTTSTLQIIDVRTLPDSVTVVYDSNSLLFKSHNIFIDSTTEKMYTCATVTNTGYQPLSVYDISTPGQPVHIGNYNSFGGGTVGHVHDITVRHDTAFLHCGNNGFFVADFSNPNGMQPLGSLTTYPDQGYNHSGYLTEDGNYYYMADENHDHDMKILDVSDLSNIEVKGTFDAGSTSAFSIAHNQLIKDTLLFVSYYYDGLQVYSIADPENPQRIYYYDTYPAPHNSSYEGAWGVYPYLPSGNILVSDMQTGLYVLKLGTTVSTPKVAANGIDFKIYPQPFGEQFRVELDLTTQEEASFMLYDMSGRLVEDFGTYQLNSGINMIDFRPAVDLSSGVYILKMNGDHTPIIKKVVKQ